MGIRIHSNYFYLLHRAREYADGGMTLIEPDLNDFEDARGVAIDPGHHLLYVIDRQKSASGTGTLRSIPLN